jgi:hypothetical protein
VKATAKVAGSAVINTADSSAKEHLMPTYMDVERVGHAASVVYEVPITV